MENNLFYKKIKSISSGCRTLDDALFICNNTNLNKFEKDLTLSIIHSMKYHNILDIKTMLKYINEMNNYKYKEDCYDLINNIMQKTNEAVQIKTFQRIANLKPSRPQYVTLKDIRDKNIIMPQKCPHCHHMCYGSDDTSYIICGYTHTGYDWEGCGKDWCFKCGKILCKSWENDQLYLPINRIHDKTCCKKHAKINNKNYLDDYCQCNTNYVVDLY
jgi:hypothetical protein